jgi:putative DNA primase/helicase
VNLQRIWLEHGKSYKRYWQKAKRECTYFAINGNSRTVAVCEGVATAITIHEATGWTVLAAGDTSQLMNVAKMVRERKPQSRIMLCADDDRHTEGNPGVTKARAAAAAVSGYTVIPRFADLESRGTDFNDLYIEEGLPVVREQLEYEEPPLVEPPPGWTDEPLPEHERVEFEEREEWSEERPAPGEKPWVPEGYRFNNGVLCRKVHDKPDVLVSHVPLWVAGYRVDAIDGTKSLVMRWTQPSKGSNKFEFPQQMIVDRGVLLNSRSIVSLTSAGFPVDSGCASEVVAYIRKAEAAYLEHTVREASEVVSSVTGWHGATDWTAPSFLVGSHQVGESCPVFEHHNPELARHIGGFTVSGSADVHLETLRGVVSAHPDMATVVAMALGSPLLRLVGAPVFVLDIACESSRGKTKALMVAASVFGSSQTMRSWDTTKFALEAVANCQRGITLLLDETQRASKPEMVQPTVYDLCNTEGKMRGKADGGMRATAKYESLVISTGEQSIAAFGDAGGARARILTIQGSPWQLERALPLGEAVRRLTTYQTQVLDTLADHHGHAGRLFVERLAALSEDERRGLRARWRELVGQRTLSVETLSPSHPIGARLAGYAATIDLAGELAEQWLGLAPASWLSENRWASMLAGGKPADVATQAMERMVQWAWSKTSALMGHADNEKTGKDCIGVWALDAQGRVKLQLTVGAANDMLKQAGFQPGAVSQTWAARGWLVGDRQSVTSRVVSVQGIKVRMYDLSVLCLEEHVWPPGSRVTNQHTDEDLGF